jgi:hypothetical protein
MSRERENLVGAERLGLRSGIRREGSATTPHVQVSSAVVEVRG